MEKEKLNYILSFEAFRESEEFQLFKRLRKSRLVLYSIRHNYISLSKSFKQFHIRESYPIFWNNLSPHLRWNTQKRITTDILNYLSSASSIIDISRNFSNVELNPTELEDYKQIVFNAFDQNVEFKIIRKLRNYILHYSLLDVGVFSNWDYRTGKTKSTYLFPEKLLDWDGWNSEEKEFIRSQGKRFNIEPIIYQYHHKFMEIQNILFLKIIRKYQLKIEELVRKMDELMLQGETLNMTNPLPFRKNTVRYLKCLLKEIRNIS